MAITSPPLEQKILQSILKTYNPALIDKSLSDDQMNILIGRALGQWSPYGERPDSFYTSPTNIYPSNTTTIAPPGLEEDVRPSLIQTPKNNLKKSPEWIASQIDLSRTAAEAGLPSFTPTQSDSSARLRLMDAISRSEASGFKVPHFIGTPTEPTGDRGVTMDIENLVKALKLQQQAAVKARNNPAIDKISRELAYWEKEAAEGMSAQEWKSQTGELDPVYPQ